MPLTSNFIADRPPAPAVRCSLRVPTTPVAYSSVFRAVLQRVRPGLWIGDQRAERAEFAILQASSISHVLQVRD